MKQTPKETDRKKGGVCGVYNITLYVGKVGFFIGKVYMVDKSLRL